ncbi:hypothetical protein HRI_002720700 [Hibiscus trionum]|uniref:Uncharacterized protein n=1 Tax=Hibiscus trionum TaxID=183268 RepID=A0A9W7M7J6_HIBTR|nr:hypothetical protein HRI_002720700 [Hibiscus trionum]
MWSGQGNQTMAIQLVKWEWLVGLQGPLLTSSLESSPSPPIPFSIFFGRQNSDCTLALHVLAFSSLTLPSDVYNYKRCGLMSVELDQLVSALIHVFLFLKFHT